MENILISNDNITTLTPAYDLLNTSIVIKNVSEEIALPLKGKKSKLKRQDFIDYFATEYLRLNNRTIDNVLKELSDSILKWEKEIAISFMSDEMKEDYSLLLRKRCETIGID